MTALRTLSHDYQEVMALAQDPDLPAIALTDTLEALEGAFNDKAVALVHVLINADSDVNAIDVELKRLQARKQIIQNGQKRLKDYLRENMEACEIKKIDCPLFSITLAAGRSVAVITDESALPDDFVRVKTSIVPDKLNILKALKSGDDVPGAHIGKSVSSVRIK